MSVAKTRVTIDFLCSPRLSFESAANRLGAKVIGFADGESSRSGSSWNEKFTDTAQMINAYADIAVIRHAEVEPVHNYCIKSRLPVQRAPFSFVSPYFTI